MKIVWWATGNGIVIGADTARRSLLARLEPQCEHPEDRLGPRPGQPWKYPDILTHVKEHRASLLTDALTIVSAYLKADRPDLRLSPMGSFEEWSQTIRSAIVWAGGQDPCTTAKDTRKADLEDLSLHAMVECWPFEDGVAVTAATLIDFANTNSALGMDPAKRTAREMWKNALLDWLPAKKGDFPTARELGYALRSIDGSIIGNFKIESGQHSRSGVPWSRTRISGSEDAQDERTEKQNLSIIK
jgi:hypothetical protein